MKEQVYGNETGTGRLFTRVVGTACIPARIDYKIATLDYLTLTANYRPTLVVQLSSVIGDTKRNRNTGSTDKHGIKKKPPPKTTTTKNNHTHQKTKPLPLTAVFQSIYVWFVQNPRLKVAKIRMWALPFCMWQSVISDIVNLFGMSGCQTRHELTLCALHW